HLNDGAGQPDAGAGKDTRKHVISLEYLFCKVKWKAATIIVHYQDQLNRSLITARYDIARDFTAF
ncbi:MAG: hypothetical protein JW704_13625, partial [Anaerolineaceae bacterium]|nr:hypothetical protein [Anaerolineaceae bacterium]